MLKLISAILFLVVVSLPVSATEPPEVIEDGIFSDVDPTSSTDPVDSLDPEADSPAPLADQEAGQDPALAGLPGGFSGGYWFTCDCALGSGITFYVPLEWAFDVFALDSSGAPVNMSNSTCNAYCPAYPDYTFTASRFGTFQYRSSNHTNVDLRITNITDSNLVFLEGVGSVMSDQDAQLLTNALIFIVAAILIFKKG